LFFSTIALPIIILFGGFMVTRQDASVWFHWAFDICFAKYAGDSSIATILGYNRSKLNCDDEFYCHFQRPDKFLETIGVGDTVTELSMAILIGYLILFRLVAFFMIDYRLRH
jgi:ATP-binding cassette, subfamily G (WHITE), member 1